LETGWTKTGTKLSSPGLVSFSAYFMGKDYLNEKQKMCCSPSKPFVVVLEKPILLNKISPFAVDFELSIFAGLFMFKHT